MKDQFDVWRFHFPDKGEHPVVIISHPDGCKRAAVVNAYKHVTPQGFSPRGARCL